MLTPTLPVAGIDSEEFGFSVYAHIDQETLNALDQAADQQVLPRSWLISQILQDWAAQHTTQTSQSADAPKTLAA